MQYNARLYLQFQAIQQAVMNCMQWRPFVECNYATTHAMKLCIAQCATIHATLQLCMQCNCATIQCIARVSYEVYAVARFCGMQSRRWRQWIRPSKERRSPNTIRILDPID